MAQTVKNLPAMREIWVRPLGQEESLEIEVCSRLEGLAELLCILVTRIPQCSPIAYSSCLKGLLLFLYLLGLYP